LYLPKSRYDSVSYFISEQEMFKKEYNDVKFRVNQEIIEFTKQKAKEVDIDLDDNLLNHLGFLFVRDPLVIFDDKIYVDDTKTTSHFENFQSTNWNSVRFKPPPGMNSDIGWRVELRPTEIQLTDEENASFILFALFIARYITIFHPNFYIPMSLVDQNFKRAHERGAAVNQKFWFRKNIPDDKKDDYVELTTEEFLKGKKDCFTGIMSLVDRLDEKHCTKHETAETKAVLEKNKDQFRKLIDSLIEKSTGKIPTLATWTRKFVHSHPKYNNDSIINQAIASDLITAMNDISQGKKTYSDFA